jgi:hypothetical protein
MDQEESWEGSMGRKEDLQGEEDPNSLQDKYCSSCNQKKPLTDFGCFLTCNTCQQRDTKANQARHIRQKALLNKSSQKDTSSRMQCKPRDRATA